MMEEKVWFGKYRKTWAHWVEELARPECLIKVDRVLIFWGDGPLWEPTGRQVQVLHKWCDTPPQGP